MIEKFEFISQVIQSGDYEFARRLLRDIDHPKAREWLNKLDEIDPDPAFPEAPKSQGRWEKNVQVKKPRLPKFRWAIWLFLIVIAIGIQWLGIKVDKADFRRTETAQAVIDQATSTPTSTNTGTPASTPSATLTVLATPIPTNTP
jgi:cytoskeletal protein RodZ